MIDYDILLIELEKAKKLRGEDNRAANEILVKVANELTEYVLRTNPNVSYRIEEIQSEIQKDKADIKQLVRIRRNGTEDERRKLDRQITGSITQNINEIKKYINSQKKNHNAPVINDEKSDNADNSNQPDENTTIVEEEEKKDELSNGNDKDIVPLVGLLSGGLLPTCIGVITLSYSIYGTFFNFFSLTFLCVGAFALFHLGKSIVSHFVPIKNTADRNNYVIKLALIGLLGTAMAITYALYDYNKSTEQETLPIHGGDSTTVEIGSKEVENPATNQLNSHKKNYQNNQPVKNTEVNEDTTALITPEDSINELSTTFFFRQKIKLVVIPVQCTEQDENHSALETDIRDNLENNKEFDIKPYVNVLPKLEGKDLCALTYDEEISKLNLDAIAIVDLGKEKIKYIGISQPFFEGEEIVGNTNVQSISNSIYKYFKKWIK